MKHFLVSVLMVTASSLVYAQPIVTDSTSRSTTETTLKSPPPTAVAPAVTTINNDVCAVAASGAVQTQILGISMGGTMRDMNCERIKLAKNLYDMGMKVAAVATLCQDERIFTAMIAAGTPCPVEGKIGTEAKEEWEKRGVTTKGSDIGFYANPTPKKSEVKKEQFICKDYAGDDPAVKERLGCK
ncbi:MAG: uncultured phage MedDCM-OCT-S28-C10 [Bacteroidota bacterium]|jgi:hypothetical protein